MQALYQLFVMHLQQHFDDTRNTGSQLQVPNIAFYRTNTAYASWCRRIGADPLRQFAERGLESIDFNQVSKRSSSSVRFDVGHRARINPSLAVGRY
jgi:hypothetical protein